MVLESSKNRHPTQTHTWMGERTARARRQEKGSLGARWNLIRMEHLVLPGDSDHGARYYTNPVYSAIYNHQLAQHAKIKTGCKANKM